MDSFFRRGADAMVKLFEEMIREFHASHIPTPSRRDIFIPSFPEHVRKALVFIGMRRSGKTWMLYQVMKDLMAQGVDITKIVYINFEDERLSDMQKNNFQDILKAYFQLFPEYTHRRDIHFFFDEIHEIPLWEKFIRRLLDQGHMNLYITGSSSKMLSKEIATSLRDRTYSLEVYPFSFGEVLRQKNIATTEPIVGRTKNQVIHQLRIFLERGGFPEVLDRSSQEHRNLLQEYTSTVLYRDIVDRYGVRSILVLKHLLTHSLRNSATQFSITKMHNSLKSMGIDASRTAMYEFMGYFEDAYCVFSLDKYTISFRKSSQSVKKIFAVDQGLITSVTMASKLDESAQLETAVFAHLRRQTSQLFYYRSSDNKEVDFISILDDQTMHLYQVSLSIADEETRKREVSALETAMKELQIQSGTIITLDENEIITTSYGTIYVVPAWKLFLGL